MSYEIFKILNTELYVQNQNLPTKSKKCMYNNTYSVILWYYCNIIEIVNMKITRNIQKKYIYIK